jgi:ureidoacrylate peracid hydrolase
MATEEARKILAKAVMPASAALIVIDVQNDFCAKGGYYDQTGADLSFSAPAIERMVQLIDSARAAGVRVIFARNHYDDVYVSETQRARARRVGWYMPYCLQGSWGADFYRVAPLPGETIVTKHRYDAFYNTDLEVVLRSNKVQSLILTGVATNVCVESTMRSAYFRDFEVVVVEDCCAARNVSAHEASLENVRKHFGLVAAAADIEQVWRDAAAKPRLAAVGG